MLTKLRKTIDTNADHYKKGTGKYKAEPIKNKQFNCLDKNQSRSNEYSQNNIEEWMHDSGETMIEVTQSEQKTD